MVIVMVISMVVLQVAAHFKLSICVRVYEKRYCGDQTKGLGAWNWVDSPFKVNFQIFFIFEDICESGQ